MGQTNWTMEPEYWSGERKAKTGNFDILDAEKKWVCTIKTGEANARLIVEAPAMLAALESLVGRFGGSSRCALDTIGLQAARAAIRAARGTE